MSAAGEAGEAPQSDGLVGVAVVRSAQLAPHGGPVLVIDLEVVTPGIVLDLRQEPGVDPHAAVVTVLADVQQDEVRPALAEAPGVDLGADGVVDAVVGEAEAERPGRHVDVDVARADSAVRTRAGN